MLSKDEEIFLAELTQANAVPGNEVAVQKLFRKHIESDVDEILYDGLGSIIAKHSGVEEGPKIMFAGHLDEVGFMVSQITDRGFLKFQTLGGWWGQVMLAQQVTVTTQTGATFRGVIGSKPPHVLSVEARRVPYEISDMFIDLGATSAQEVSEWGIKPGDMITPYIEYQRLNGSKYLLAKAWDNRIGLAVTIRVMQNLIESGHDNIIYGVGNVQEEVGLRGSRTSTHLVNPDIAFALDTGTAGDTPGMTPREADSVLGQGPQIIIYDASMIPHKKLKNFVIEVAEEMNISFQYTVITGGTTDAGAQHITKNGIPSLAITVPTRYLHSHTSIIHEDDYLATIKLVTEVVKRLDAETVAELKSFAE